MAATKIFVLLIALTTPLSVSAGASKSTYKTYTNTTYGYSFTYPSSLQPDVYEDGASVVIMYNPKEQAIPKMQSVQVYVEKNVNRWTFEKLVQHELESPKVGALGEYKPKIKAKNTKVNKVKAKQMTYKNDLGSVTTDVVFLKDNLVWHIAGNIDTREFQRLLKSFKFTAPTK